jgi:hypothetical protein
VWHFDDLVSVATLYSCFWYWVPLFVRLFVFSSFLFLQKLQPLFFAERTHFFLTWSPQKTLKIAKDSPKKQIPACYMPV